MHISVNFYVIAFRENGVRVSLLKYNNPELYLISQHSHKSCYSLKKDEGLEMYKKRMNMLR